MNDDREDAARLPSSPMRILLGAGAAHDDGIDGFEVAWVGGQVEGDRLAVGRVVFAGCADVVLHVAAAEKLRGSTSSNLAKMSAGERPMVLVMTLRRPRWLMAIMAC